MAVVLRAIAATGAGMVAALVLLVAVELFSAVVHPVPPDFGGTTAEMCEHVARYPHWVLAVVVPLWAGTALAGTWIAGRLGNRGCGLLLGGLLMAALVFNLSMLPYPIWFKFASLVAIPLAIAGGVYWSGRTQAAAGTHLGRC